MPSEYWYSCCVFFNMSHMLYLFFSTMATLSDMKEVFRRADAVCFDVDSTVIKEEGIDELAKFCGVGDAVTEMYVYTCCQHHFNVHWKVPQNWDYTWIYLNNYANILLLSHFRTRKAMGGSMSFKTALIDRLSIIRCSREQVNKLLTDHPPQLTPGIRGVCEVLMYIK